MKRVRISKKKEDVLEVTSNRDLPDGVYKALSKGDPRILIKHKLFFHAYDLGGEHICELSRNSDYDVIEMIEAVDFLIDPVHLLRKQLEEAKRVENELRVELARLNKIEKEYKSIKKWLLNIPEYRKDS